MKKIAFIAVIYIILIASSASIASELKPDGCKKFNEALRDCSIYKCVMKSPDESDKYGLIIHKIKGFNEDGKCIHEQDSNLGIKIDCEYSEKTRMIISGFYEEKEGEDVAKDYMPSVFVRECFQSRSN